MCPWKYVKLVGEYLWYKNLKELGAYMSRFIFNNFFPKALPKCCVFATPVLNGLKQKQDLKYSTITMFFYIIYKISLFNLQLKYIFTIYIL